MVSVSNSGSGEWKDESTWENSVLPSQTESVALDFFDPSRPLNNYRVVLESGVRIRDLSIHNHNELHFVSSQAFILADRVSIGRGGVFSGTGTLDAHHIFNAGSIEADSGSLLTLQGLTSAINNVGRLLAVQGNLDVKGNLDNSGMTHADSHTLNVMDVRNTGELLITGTKGQISVQGALDNSAKIETHGAGVGTTEMVVHGATTNTGDIGAIGVGGLITFDGRVTNTKQMVADSHGSLDFLAGVTNTRGGQLFANNGGTIDIHGAATGGTAIIEGHGSVVTFGGSATQTTTTDVVFRGEGKLVLLDHSAHYGGSISGFALGDFIDVADIKFVAGRDSFNHETDVLTIRDGVNTTRIQLEGSHSANDFAFESDGRGGTLIVGQAQPALALLHL